MRGFVSVSSSARSKRGLRPSLQVTIGTAQRCPFCHEHLHTDDPLVACAECLTVFHEVCVDEGQVCTTLGCGRSRPDSPPTSGPPPALAAERTARPLATAAALAVAFAGLGVASWTALKPPTVVIVQPPPPPVIHHPGPHVVEVPVAQSAAPRVELAFQSILTADPMVDVRGTIHAEGPVDLTLSTSSGDITLRQRPGPFVGTVTVGPGAGTHQVVVRIRDDLHREAVAVVNVQYAPR